MTGRGLRRYVEDLLRGHRPQRFRPDDAEAAVLRAAITLRAARPGEEGPGEEFVAALHERLAAELADRPRAGAVTRSIGRRGLVAGGLGVAAASAALGVLVDRAVLSGPEQGPAGSGDTLTPARGEWRTISASDELPEGAVRPFDLGAVVGFVRRTGGVVLAVSGMCTHQGCRLLLDAASRQLDCPCHTTVFALTGELVTHQLPIAPAPLPQIAARELDGSVQVFTPRV